MELKNILEKRKSIRAYQKKDVKSWVVGELLDTARQAPSSGNAQNWRFIVVRDEKIKNKIASASLEQYWMNTAPVFIVICSDNLKTKALYKKKAEKFTRENCAIAATYIMLKAVEFDLGTCWVGAFDTSRVSDILFLPKDITPEIILTVGYPEQDQLVKPSPKRHDLDKLVFFEKYKGKIAPKEQKRLADHVKGFIKKLKKPR